MKKFETHDEFETLLKLIFFTGYYAENDYTKLHICKGHRIKNNKTVYLPFYIEEKYIGLLNHEYL